MRKAGKETDLEQTLWPLKEIAQSKQTSKKDKKHPNRQSHLLSVQCSAYGCRKEGLWRGFSRLVDQGLSTCWHGNMSHDIAKLSSGLALFHLNCFDKLESFQTSVSSSKDNFDCQIYKPS